MRGFGSVSRTATALGRLTCGLLENVAELLTHDDGLSYAVVTADLFLSFPYVCPNPVLAK